MYRTVFELLVSVKLFLGRFDMRTMQVSHLWTLYCAKLATNGVCQLRSTMIRCPSAAS